MTERIIVDKINEQLDRWFKGLTYEKIKPEHLVVLLDELDAKEVEILLQRRRIAILRELLAQWLDAYDEGRVDGTRRRITVAENCETMKATRAALENPDD